MYVCVSVCVCVCVCVYVCAYLCVFVFVCVCTYHTHIEDHGSLIEDEDHGSLIEAHGRMTGEVTRRIAQASRVFGELRSSVFTACDLSLELND